MEIEVGQHLPLGKIIDGGYVGEAKIAGNPRKMIVNLAVPDEVSVIGDLIALAAHSEPEGTFSGEDYVEIRANRELRTAENKPIVLSGDVEQPYSSQIRSINSALWEPLIASVVGGERVSMTLSGMSLTVNPRNEDPPAQGLSNPNPTI